MKTIYPCIWYNSEARTAGELYAKAFQNLKITGDNGLVTSLSYGTERLMLLNGGPYFTVNPSISLYVNCQTEEEVNHAWKILSKDGTILMPLNSYPWSKCYGWLQDKYGLSWQLFYTTENVSQKFIPCFLFSGNLNGKTQTAFNFYSTVFANSEILLKDVYGEGEGNTAGYIRHARFRLRETLLIAMDGGTSHKYGFNEGFSLVVECADQAEIDYFWEKLTQGGEESQCGWLKDRFGVSWQIVPEVLSELMCDPERSQRVVNAFMKMKKFDIEALMNA